MPTARERDICTGSRAPRSETRRRRSGRLRPPVHDAVDERALPQEGILCHGSDMNRRETERIVGAIRAARQAGQRVALATIVRVRGSAYRREGARILVREDG